MHIETDVVAEMVRKQSFDRLARHIESQLGKAVLKAIFGNFVEFVEGDASGCAAESDTGTLGGEDGVVEVALGGGEGAGNRPDPGDVGDIHSNLLK